MLHVTLGLDDWMGRSVLAPITTRVSTSSPASVASLYRLAGVVGFAPLLPQPAPHGRPDPFPLHAQLDPCPLHARRYLPPPPTRLPPTPLRPHTFLVAHRSESTSVQQPARTLAEYMSLPTNQYLVLDAERIECVDESTFRCYVYRFRFLALEVCPVLLVRVDKEPNGCCIHLLSCKLKGSPHVEAQHDKFSIFEEVRRELAALHPDNGQIVVHTRGAWRVKGII